MGTGFHARDPKMALHTTEHSVGGCARVYQGLLHVDCRVLLAVFSSYLNMYPMTNSTPNWYRRRWAHQARDQVTRTFHLIRGCTPYIYVVTGLKSRQVDPPIGLHIGAQVMVIPVITTNSNESNWRTGDHWFRMNLYLSECPIFQFF